MPLFEYKAVAPSGETVPGVRAKERELRERGIDPD